MLLTPWPASRISTVTFNGAVFDIAFAEEHDATYITDVRIGGVWWNAPDALSDYLLDLLNRQLETDLAEQARADAEDDAIARAIDRSGPDYRTYEEWMRDKVAGERWQRLHGDAA